jgi:light-regulated signal transduction histidine kinase (bacteriophytochrome)
MGGGRPYDVTHRIVRRDDGQVRVVHARGELVADEAGRPARVRGWAQDITGLAATEEALRRANLALQAKHKELQDFFFIASHDLQEPLRTIQAFGQRLRSEHAETMGETGREYLWRMERAAGRMQALIQDLLAYSRVTSQGERPALADLGEIAREARGDLEQRIEEAGGRIDIGDLPTAEVDFVQMRQVFQNLFANAIKFRGSESLRVSVDAEKAVVNGRETARIAVRDNGIGFDEQFLDRIFEPFQRLHGKNAYEGTGIGLAIVRRILERHGGTIAARSAPGEGATFILSLPVRTERERPRPDAPA